VAALIEAVFWDRNRGRGISGPRTVWRLRHRDGVQVARCTVERLMPAQGLRGTRRGKPPKVVYWFPSLGGEVQGFGVHQTGVRPTHAIAAFERITRIARITRGNFRLLERLFPQIGRVLKIDQLEAITDDVIEAAASILVIGN